MEGATIETKSKVFVNRVKNEGNDWIFNNILRFMQFHLDRANQKEITVRL